MRKSIYLMYDLFCVAAALVVALYLRNGFPLIQEGTREDLYLLLLIMLGASLLVFPLMQTHASMWRFTSSAELANILIAVALVIFIGSGALFLISRLEMMPRSVPPMQWALVVVAMGGSRLLARRFFGPSRALNKNPRALQHVIVVGVCHAAELYLEFIKRIVQHRVVVEGFVDADKSLTNWMFQKHKVLGTPEDLPHIIEQLNVHGIHVSQIIMAQLLNELPKSTQKMLTELERSGAVELIHFSKHIGPQLKARDKKNMADFYQSATSTAASVYRKPSGFYPYAKRFLDIIIGIALFVLLLPLMLIIALVVMLDVGTPVLFWQKRPGLFGKPFRLYKFRTMHQSGRKFGEAREDHKSGDQKRTSSLGKWIRRLRLDELPQIVHIITGTMALVGPRPLLPDDQPEHGEVRLSVRPGITGWAQIHGGDALTPKEKLALDVWYIRHMSFWLDIRILFATLFAVLRDDQQYKERLSSR